MFEEARVAELMNVCAKKNLNFKVENDKYLAQKAEANKKANEKKELAEAKKQAKLDAMSPEQKERMDTKKAAQLEKQKRRDEEALLELNNVRQSLGRNAVIIE